LRPLFFIGVVARNEVIIRDKQENKGQRDLHHLQMPAEISQPVLQPETVGGKVSMQCKGLW
jgi:hypothetical protein